MSPSTHAPSSGAAKSQTTDALVLRATDYRDADRVITLFTQHFGKVSAIARGARASKRRFAGTLEPYAVIRVELEPGRADLMTLKRAELVRTFPNILRDLSRMDVAGAALSLLREAHPARVADQPMFIQAVQFLTLIDLEGDPERALLLGFALRVLALSGLAPRLDACGKSQQPVPEGRPAYFDPALGAVVSRRFGGGPFLLSARLRTRLMRAQSEDWLQVSREPWEQAELQVARAAVAAFIEKHVDQATANRLFSS